MGGAGGYLSRSNGRLRRVQLRAGVTRGSLHGRLLACGRAPCCLDIGNRFVGDRLRS